MDKCLKKAFEKQLGCQIQNSHSVHGGDINEAYRLETNKGSFFVKYNSASRFPKMFEREAEGLELLRRAEVCLVPKVLGIGQQEDQAFLILEWIETARASEGFWANFGRALARLHKVSHRCFGLKGEERNYIGSLPQYNLQKQDWADFYISQRLRPQLNMAKPLGLLNQQILADFEQLFERLPNRLPKEPPALIHGDLWSGNFMVSSSDQPVLIDPAICFANREMDLAMTELFGGFRPDFYKAYQAEYPIPIGFEWRKELYQLYYLLVHVNLFGGHYVESVQRSVQRLLNS